MRAEAYVAEFSGLNWCAGGEPTCTVSAGPARAGNARRLGLRRHRRPSYRFSAIVDPHQPQWTKLLTAVTPPKSMSARTRLGARAASSSNEWTAERSWVGPLRTPPTSDPPAQHWPTPSARAPDLATHAVTGESNRLRGCPSFVTNRSPTRERCTQSARIRVSRSNPKQKKVHLSSG